MASDTLICNKALTKLGSARILTLSDDSKQAASCNAIYETVRDAELRAHLWNFSLARASLPSLVSVPDWGFTKEFQLPADCLKVFQVNDIFVGLSLSDYRNSDESEFAIEQGKILADFASPLKIRYVKRQTDAGSFDALFVDTLACRMAYELAEDLTQSATKKQSALQDYQLSIRTAVRNNAIERPPSPIPDDSWMIARL